jgi:hypothetical protein
MADIEMLADGTELVQRKRWFKSMITIEGDNIKH